MGCLAMTEGRRRESISYEFHTTEGTEIFLSMAAINSRWTRFCFKLVQDFIFFLETRITVNHGNG